MIINKEEINPIIYRARVARLATADYKARPHVVTVVFVFDGEKYYIPIDEKTKITRPDKLRRIKNIEVNPTISLLIDEYNEDWKKLFFIMIQGKAAILGKKRGDEEEEEQYDDDNNNKLLKIAHKLFYTKYLSIKKLLLENYV